MQVRRTGVQKLKSCCCLSLSFLQEGNQVLLAQPVSNQLFPESLGLPVQLLHYSEICTFCILDLFPALSIWYCLPFEPQSVLGCVTFSLTDVHLSLRYKALHLCENSTTMARRERTQK